MLDNAGNLPIMKYRGITMGARVKPVQPTVIKDKRIVQDVISEIHSKPGKRELAQLQEGKEVLRRAMAR